MILAMNIGNTNFALRIKQNDRISKMRYPSKLFKTQSDFVRVINQAIVEMRIKKESVTGVILSSVNPRLTNHLEGAVNEVFLISPITINASMNMKLNLSCYDTSQIGSDRIAICEAAISKHHAPLIVFDFGTATTINVIDKNGCFIGGSILSGLMMGINALAKDTAQLPQSEPGSEALLIGRNTQECIVSGAIFGNAAMLDGMAARIEKLLGQKATVIITGGNANYVLPVCKTPMIHDPDLLFEGLHILYQCNL